MLSSLHSKLAGFGTSLNFVCARVSIDLNSGRSRFSVEIAGALDAPADSWRENAATSAAKLPGELLSLFSTEIPSGIY
jgi:hypothetical protein